MSNDEKQMDDSTASLISGLAMQAGRRQTIQLGLGIVLTAALLVGVLASAGLILMTAGVRADLMDILVTRIFQFKVIAMVLVAAAAIRLVLAAARPGLDLRPALMLLPAAVFLLSGAALDQRGFPVFGVHTLSVPICAGIIVAASMPALFIILAAMRSGTPTRLSRAGAAAGLLAGSIGALVYTIACLNDGAAFVALWYSVAISIVTIIGAMIGPKALAW